MICDSDCRILNVNAKYGGATHDAFIWENSIANNYMQELHRNNEHVWLLGDSGYPQRPWLMTPIPDATEGTPAYKYTAIHGKTRNRNQQDSKTCLYLFLTIFFKKMEEMT
ncbi:hypothetical protein PYW07_009617 [Mythimna separata]|uniref:DDE Tnp4 domain-containing protein n=1 Tax=Mythimna separata TaxID=271217 RepID=A0AAD7YCW0_MYTSE|nr:hypothetical protein PYW07_009617 [Mythimna separata]